MKKTLTLVLAIIMAALCLSSCGKAADDNKTTAENSTATNEEVKYENVAVLDDEGNPVLDEQGEPVTKKVPVNEAQGSSSDKSASNNGGKEETTGIEAKQVGGSSTTKPTTPPATEKSTTAPETKPAAPKPTPTPPTTEAPTEAPTTPPTTEQPKPEFDINYWVEFAKSYGQSIGMNLLTDVTPDTGSWDMPIIADERCIYLERDIKDFCNFKKNEGFTDFWVYASSNDFDGNPRTDGSYYLYIGY